MTIDILLPIYNEEKILEANTRLLFNYCRRHLIDDWQLILIINGSVDQSLTIAENLAQELGKIKIISLPDGGKGRALKAGLQYSMAEVVVYMDIDLAVSLSALLPLINLVTNNNCDIAIASRLLPASQTERSWLRDHSSKLYNCLANRLLHGQISDWQCGFKAMNANLRKNIAPLIRDNGWFFDTELLALAQKNNLRITELPVSWSENRYIVRQSKVRPLRDGFLFLKNLLRLRKRLKKTQK